ncbi:hypothetical protein CYLTODRAFT_421774 [Cylindrobasidium torrendii FP15055 ss-10]|uniref:F-box domain-containing protein n=1 Tax=Cylindrobasidium torrendii FP15055 ss-10 TaxID=1314674 RepID=A0A0D7BDP8_9AGAR|nr:hypothetical protein CYLTODRAFT_421774 [Cylindrobasidium torrendii FP15055 ss-10]
MGKNVEQCPLCAFRFFTDYEAPRAQPTHVANADILTPEEDNASRKSVAMLLERKSTVDAAIARAEAQITRMKATSARLEDEIYTLRAAYHPVRSLPDDVLYSIFDWCNPGLAADQTARTHFSSLDPSWTPWRLSTVSRRWRALAQGYPRLWTTVYANVTLRYAAVPRARVIDRLREYLKRSRDASLTVWLAGALNPEDIIPLIRDVACRIRLLETEVASTVLAGLEGASFDRLEHLRVDFERQFEDSANVAPDSDLVIRAFKDAPRLINFEHNDGDCRIPIDIPWTQLENTSLWYCPFPGLTAAPLKNLRVLRIVTELTGTVHWEDPGLRVELPFLDTIHIYLSSFLSIGSIFRHMNAPSLRHLALAAPSDDVPEMDWLAQVPESITDLTVACARMEGMAPEAIMGLLQRARRVQNIYIGLNEDVLDGVLALFRASQPSELLPELRTLRTNAAKKSMHFVQQLVQWKMSGSERLRSVVLHQGGESTEDWNAEQASGQFTASTQELDADLEVRFEENEIIEQPDVFQTRLQRNRYY